MKTKEIIIPEISDEVLTQRLKQIKYVTQAMQGIDGKVYSTDEQDKNLFDLFYVESNVNPRTEAFNFDENRKLTTRVTGLKELLTKDIFVSIGGYYGFCKITFAEVMSQIPDEIVSEVVAFTLNPEKDPKILNDNYQSASIIFYGKGEELKKDNKLPSVKDLIKPLDLEKAERLKDKVKPILDFQGEGLIFINPGDIHQPFIKVGIWLRINGSNLHEHNTETKVDFKTRLGKKVSTYQSFDNELGADFFHPNYGNTISQIPDELINENTVGILYNSTDYFKTEEGVVHKTEYTLVERV
jgi:hypothetical protein